MSEATLFDWVEPVLPVRRTDPATSRAAAKSLDRRKREAEVLAALRSLGVASTSHDVAAVTGQPSNFVASRLRGLEGRGLVRRGGVAVGPYGKACGLWRLT